MGFGDFLQRFFKQPEPEPQRLTIAGVKRWLRTRQNADAGAEGEVMRELRERVQDFLRDLDEKTEILSHVDYESRKVEGKAKAVVRGNLNKYLHLLAGLRDDIASVEEERLAKLVAQLQRLIVVFVKKSHKNYHRTTLLVGNEVSDTKRCVASLAEYLTELGKQQHELIKEAGAVTALADCLQELDDAEVATRDFEQEVAAIDKRLTAFTQQEGELDKRLERLKESDAYRAREQAVTAKLAAEQERDARIHRLRTLIDFKAMGNELHGDAKRMQQLSEHKDAFKERYCRDCGKTLRALLEAAGVKDGKILAAMQAITDTEQRLSGIKIPKTDGTEALAAERAGLESDRDALQRERGAVTKRLQRSKGSHAQLRSNLQQAMAALQLELK